VTEAETRDIRQRLKDDLEFYARNCLFLRTKDASIVHFEFNSAQRYLHELIEEQRQRTGKVRALVLKGRQQGCSTYVEGRFYHRVTHSHGVQAFILTHEDEASKNIFGMAQRFYAKSPDWVE
jgi:hypothetical protein